MTKDHESPARSAGVVVVRRTPQGWQFLVLRAFRHWDFPKGLVAPGEAPVDAAIREVVEETGLADLVFRWGEKYHETEPYARGKVARYYVAESGGGEAHLPVSAALGRPEHHELRWVDYAAARTLLVPRVRRALDWAARAVAAG